MPLKLSNTGFSYSRGAEQAIRALNDVSVEVSERQLLLVVGATGSGKSTLMRMLAGLLEADSGAASIDGETLTATSARGRVGLVFQDPESQLFADSVLADVTFGPRNMGLSREAAEAAAREALTVVGLDPGKYANRSPFSLSGGEARRVAIAGVIAMRPAYLLCDEPTAGLDVAGRRGVKKLIVRERERAGVVVVSHAAEEFLDVADRVLVLDSGRVLWTGTAEELLGEPSVLAQASLRLPPVLEVQTAAAQKGCRVTGYTLDPGLAASRLAAAGGWI